MCTELTASTLGETLVTEFGWDASANQTTSVVLSHFSLEMLPRSPATSCWSMMATSPGDPFARTLNEP
ncbi:hypothetical protein AXA44_39775 [Rhodococcus sp. SC4]|nr:hypothetical protein AXA44_39775 [Rhodococcus sp. SC4]